MATAQALTSTPKTATEPKKAAPRRRGRPPKPPAVSQDAPFDAADTGTNQALLTTEALTIAERVNKGMAVLNDPSTQMAIAGVSAGVWEEGEVYVRLVLPAGISGGAVLSPAEAAKVAGLLLGAAWHGQANRDAT